MKKENFRQKDLLILMITKGAERVSADSHLITDSQESEG